MMGFAKSECTYKEFDAIYMIKLIESFHLP